MSQRNNIDDNACKFPFYLCERLKTNIVSTASIEKGTSPNDGERRDACVGDAIGVINSISEKFKLYMAHQVRCKCQSMAISN